MFVISGGADDQHRLVATAAEMERQPDGNSSDNDESRSAGIVVYDFISVS